MTHLDPLGPCRNYFDAWRAHDAEAVLACFAAGGDYEDPTTGGPIAGEALRGYMQALWQAFPDLAFSVDGLHRVGEDRVHCGWTMTGNQAGPFHGMPPSGRTVRLPGFDVFEVGPGGIAHVAGYFDSAALPRQLGLNVLMQPASIGPIGFGVSSAVRRDRAELPAIFAVTELVASSDEAVGPLREQSREILVGLLGNPSLLGFTTAVVGRRMCTFTAWRSHEAMEEAMRNGSHALAMRDMYTKGLVAGAHTAVYGPVRQLPMFRLCECGTMAQLDGLEGQCGRCGAPLAALP
ncbi:MAG: ester cyclase [Burkholderiaceae bacterium]|nr:ester cyclase [Burkholderiaceae bacterium]